MSKGNPILSPKLNITFTRNPPYLKRPTGNNTEVVQPRGATPPATTNRLSAQPSPVPSTHASIQPAPSPRPGSEAPRHLSSHQPYQESHAESSAMAAARPVQKASISHKDKMMANTMAKMDGAEALPYPDLEPGYLNPKAVKQLFNDPAKKKAVETQMDPRGGRNSAEWVQANRDNALDTLEGYRCRHPDVPGGSQYNNFADMDQFGAMLHEFAANIPQANIPQANVHQANVHQGSIHQGSVHQGNAAAGPANPHLSKELPPLPIPDYNKDLPPTP